MSEPFEPGIYFGLAEDAYHADPALSSSGIRNLLISPLDYWVNSPLNPGYVDEKTDAMMAGTAFHRRLLEPARFAELYASVPVREDYPDAIDGHEGLKAECERLGLKKSGKIADLCLRILDADPSARLWPVIYDRLMGDREGKIVLKPAVLADIERAAAIILAHNAAAKAMTGGFAEVSIFWIDPETGIRMKARLDYLKTKAIVDLKTFNNSLGKPIAAAVASAVANGGYHVQAAVYDAAVEAAKQMMMERKSAAIHINGPDVPNDWLTNFAACRHHTFVFVFIEQGPATNVLVREFRQVETFGGNGASQNMYWQAGHAGFRLGVSRYVECMKKFGTEKPWIDDEPIRPFRDEEFPLYMLG